MENQKMIDYTTNIVKTLSKDRADHYGDWCTIGSCLNTIDTSLLQTFINFSKFSQKYRPGDFEYRWTKILPDIDSPKQAIKLLRIFALTDNKEEYYKIKNSRINTLILEGESLENMLYELYCDKYIYSDEEKVWYQFSNHAWVKVDSIFNHYENFHSLFHDDSYKFLDKYSNLLGFNNGIYDINSHELRDGKPDDFVSFSTHIDYKSYEECLLDENLKKKCYELIDIFKKNKYYQEESVFRKHRYEINIIDWLASLISGKSSNLEISILEGCPVMKSFLLELLKETTGDYYCSLPNSNIEKIKKAKFYLFEDKDITTIEKIRSSFNSSDPVRKISFEGDFGKFIINNNHKFEYDVENSGIYKRIKIYQFESAELPEYTNEEIQSFKQPFMAIMMLYLQNKNDFYKRFDLNDSHKSFDTVY